jgi:hypothetical protein
MVSFIVINCSWSALIFHLGDHSLLQLSYLDFQKLITLPSEQNVSLGLVQRCPGLLGPVEEIRQTLVPGSRQRRKDDPLVHAEGRSHGTARAHVTPQL